VFLNDVMDQKVRVGSRSRREPVGI
jgi:hypothetical protein